ncbi:MAG TPA: hypothetical protein DD979_03200 [Gammaproteobacteria bacterium]|jgi:cytochrome oxidase Cu insertion factor (SCO1/SenC/PrrC family)|nr:hypothetical protein [Gammaproteobacteria bacterium]
MLNQKALRRHITGIALLIAGLSSLSAMTLLPNDSQKRYALPFLPGAGAPVQLVFAGYPGCGTVCPTALATLGQVATHFSARNDLTAPDITFVNIALGTPHAVTQRYAKSWHESFRAYSLRREEASSVYRELALRTYGQYQDPASHSGNIYLFSRQNNTWQLAHVYRQLPGSDSIIRDVMTLGLAPTTG